MILLTWKLHLSLIIYQKPIFLRQPRPQATMPEGHVDCLVAALITKDSVPEMFFLPVLQHQTPKKTGKFHLQIIQTP